METSENRASVQESLETIPLRRKCPTWQGGQPRQVVPRSSVSSPGTRGGAPQCHTGRRATRANSLVKVYVPHTGRRAGAYARTASLVKHMQYVLAYVPHVFVAHPINFV